MEYSKTDRSSCKKCKAGIKKDACRISKNSPSPFHDGFVSVWFHVPCFFIKEKGKLTSVDQLKGYEELRLDDQVKIAKHIKDGLPVGFVASESSASPSVASVGGAEESGMDEESERLAAENHKKLWALKDRFEKDEVSNKHLKSLLEVNGMPSSGGRQDLVSRASDAMLFGVATCPVCQQKDMAFSKGQYFCKAETAFGLCAFKGLGRASGGRVDVTAIKPDPNSEIEWIRTWKQDPLLQRQTRVVAREAVREYMRDAAQPLRSMKFTAIGQLERDKEQLQSLIINNGGSYTDDIHADIDYVLTTYEDLLRAQNTSILTTSNTTSTSAFAPPRETMHSTSTSTSTTTTTNDENDASAENAKEKMKKQILEEKRETQRKTRAAMSEKLRQAMSLKLALVTEPLLDQLLVQFGFDQSVYLLQGNLPPIALAKLATPASIFPKPSDAKLTPTSISLLEHHDSSTTATSGGGKEEGDNSSAGATNGEQQKAAPAKVGPFWGKKPTTAGPMSKLGVIDAEAKCPDGKVYKELKPKKKEEPKQEKFDATSFDSLKEPVVEKEDYEVYDRMLSYADVTSGLNKWYRLQLIDVKGTGKSFTFFTRWGRVGEIGNWTKTPEAGLATTKAAWEKKWLHKTKTQWKDRENFVKAPGAYFPVDIDGDSEDEEEEKKKKKKSGQDAGDGDASSSSFDEGESDLIPPSYLDPRLKKLVDVIFDTNMLVKSMADLKIDVKKMPLGKLNRNTLLKGYSVLKDIETVLLSTDETSRFKLPSLSSQFYTLIAHDFGRNNPEIIDNFATLRLKMRQLETLLDIMIAAQLLDEKEPLVQQNPSDLNYKHMKVELKPLSSYTREYKLIQRYVSTGYSQNTLGKTLSLVDIFKVDREGEKDSFEPFRNQRPRKLLWHASRVCNFVGILSSGLRIAPPEAPASGYLFGKAIYLSDLIEKSAPYCYPDPETGMGLLILCDVALGESLLLNKPEYITQLPEGKQSAKALAKFQPDPTKEEVGDEKVIVPIGAPTPTDLPDVFLEHSEYMVYDASQVRIKYLVQVQFSKDGTLVAPK